MKNRIIAIIAIVVVIVFLAMSCKVIDVGTEGEYTGVVAFDASASSSDDWGQVVAEITGNAKDVSEVDLTALGDGTAVTIKGQVSEYVSKAGGKKNSLTVTPDGYTGSAVFSVQIGSIYSGTAVRDAQTLKQFADFTNQTEWSEYAKALNAELDTAVVAPLALDESVKGKTVTVTGVATATGDEVTITPISITVE